MLAHSDMDGTLTPDTDRSVSLKEVVEVSSYSHLSDRTLLHFSTSEEQQVAV